MLDLRQVWTFATAALLACCGTQAGADAGPDAGPNCGTSCPQPCTSLIECAGGIGVDICAAGFCQNAGGAPQAAVAQVGLPHSFSGNPAASLTVRILDTVLPTPGPALDCPTVLGRLDAGTLDCDDPLKVNPLVPAYSVPLSHLSVGDTETSFAVEAVPSGGMPLLLVEGFLTADVDGGTDAIGCTSYAASATDGGTVTVGLQLAAW